MIPKHDSEKKSSIKGERMGLQGEDWKELLDRFPTKTDLEELRRSIMERFAIINAKLDQFVVKEMQSVLQQQETDWKKDMGKKIDAMQKNIEDMKSNKLPPWMPKLTDIIGWAVILLIAYFHPGLRNQ